jgi:hypothetical protein
MFRSLGRRLRVFGWLSWVALAASIPNSTVWADCADCRPQDVSPMVKLPEVPCDPPEVYELANARRLYEEVFPGQTRILGELRGRKLFGSPDELAIAQRILTGTLPASWTRIKRACMDVVCALAEAFGSEESARRALIIGKRDGYALTLDQMQSRIPGFSEDSVWTPLEVRAIERALSLVPDRFRHLPTLKLIRKIHPSLVRSASPNTAAYATPGPKLIAMYGWAMERGVVPTQVTFLHELAHHLDFTEEQ